MMVAENYVGKIAISNDIYEEAANLAPEMKSVGIEKCILLTEDGKDESEDTAAELEFDEVFGECDTAKKLKLISDLKSGRDETMMYVYANGIDSHSAADIDIRVHTLSLLNIIFTEKLC